MVGTADEDLIVLLSTSSASLDASPKKNWVENAGGLPPYVRKLARAIMKTGKSKSQAIAIAISRAKKWAAGGDGVNADTKAKAAKAVAQWEKAKSKNKAGKLVKATDERGEGYVMLSETTSFNTEIVRQAWNAQESAKRRAAGRRGEVPYTWIRELWTDHIIVEIEDGMKYVKVPYEVQANNQIVFGDPTPVRMKTEWVDEVALTANEFELLRDDLGSKDTYRQYIALTAE